MLRQFSHVIACSVEAAFGVASGQASVGGCLLCFPAPTLIGNTFGAQPSTPRSTRADSGVPVATEPKMQFKA